ncbi:MAG: PD40 domain-containing protein [Silvibacterium sp.]|nr:PD40 domain-containing protein [Silvibacterium sp.]MBV8435935.1 PD40 domain-containing protein [Silvibacterium sp.]
MARHTRSRFRSTLLRLVLALSCLPLVSPAQTPAPLLLRNPSLSQDRIAFLYADDIWTVPRNGGEARRLTSVNAVANGPFYSPDGTQIAYSTRKNALTEVYVVSADGGVPRRLTWDPTAKIAVGWTPDGKDVLFLSDHLSTGPFPRLFRVHADGTGSPEVFPLPTAALGSFSPDGNTLAYVPVEQWQKAWKHYRGGQTTPIWLVNIKTLDVVKVPRENSNDSSPVWEGKTVYFLSDRNGPVSLFSYDTDTKEVKQVIENHGYDLKTVSAGPGALVYEQFGSLHLYDLATHQEHTVPVTIHGDLPSLTPHLAKIEAKETQNSDISPTGVRVVVEAHGDIFTLPAEKGDTRNLTKTPAAAERDPSWSPDGKSIAYFSDASGEYQLYIRDQEGLQPPRVIDLGPDPSFFYSPRWSPDSKHIAFSDKHLRLWYVDAAGVKPVKIDTGLRGSFGTEIEVTWSPDSQWIAYTRDLENQLHAVFLYSLATHTSTQITDGMSNVAHPVFDPNGKYLYFTASTNNGPSDAGIDLSSLDRATNSGVYVVVLAKDTPSPVPPESDDENKKKEEEKKDTDKADKTDKKDDTTKTDEKAAAKGDEKKEAKKEEKPKPTIVDLPGIGNRILSLPIPTRHYVALSVGKTGVLFLAEGNAVGRPSSEDGPPIRSLWRFTTEKRKTEEILSGLNSYAVSFNGEKLFYTREDNWFIADVSDLKPGSPEATPGKPVNNGAMFATIDPRAEWKQMYHETWRIERDFFYDPQLHGLDRAKIEAKYQPFLDGLASRSEFTYLSTEMLGEIQVGHMFIGGPRDSDDGPKPGLLGADYVIESNRYKFSKIYNGQNWTPSLTAPLTLPGINIVEGEYLLAVNGRELHATDNIYSFFDGTAGRQTVLRVGKKADGSDGRDVTVVPVDSEHRLRNLDWIESNRRKVDELSGGKVAYIYMPNTGGTGYTNFNRYFYAQLDKQAVVLDERFNGGGYIADYVIDVLGQKLLSGAIERDGKPVHDPEGAIFGPKAMIINESAGSGGDAMPWYFRKANIGTLVGVKTWGGLVGIGGYPTLIDGGYVMAPRYAIYGLNGEWEVEGHGIAPDVEVENLPKDVAAGRDPQLERAVAIVLEQLKQHPVPNPPIPPYPNYHQSDSLGRQ